MISHRSVKRFCQLNDYMHKASHFIIQQCLQYDIGTIVIGQNQGWKQEVNIGKVNNQHFTSLPHLSLISKIQYKAAQYGIEVIVREESYTSKASALDLDAIPTYEKGKSNVIPFSGKRINRGLYKTSTDLLLNADVNGALNILRKEVGDSFIKSVANEGLVFRPKRVSFH
jgi:putative transposase